MPHAYGSSAQVILDVSSRGPHSQTVRAIREVFDPNLGQLWLTNTYDQLEPGLNRLTERGEWVEARAHIKIVPTGGAVVDEARHFVSFAANLNTQGAITVVIPSGDGNQLRLVSHVFGLVYFDPESGQSALIGEIRDSIGELYGDDYLVYPDCP